MKKFDEIFDELIYEFEICRSELVLNNMEFTKKSIIKLIENLQYLKESLNTKKGIQLAEDLFDCFTFFQKELQLIQSSSDIARYDEVYSILKDIRGSFFEKIFAP
jgi:flagellin-specific chaperone FliS